MLWKNYIKKLHEKENVLLFILSIIIGIIGGFGAMLFRVMITVNRALFFDHILPHISYYVSGYNIGIILLPALGGLVVGPIIYRFAREAKGHGIPEVIEAVHLRGGIIRPIVALVKIVVSSVTIGSGGSAGREGPIAQIGAVSGSVIGKLFFKAKKYKRLMVLCGVAAGISATFNAPLGGAIFAMEVISANAGLVSAIPILVSAVIGDVITTYFLGFAPAFTVPAYTFNTPSEIPIFFVVGAIFGLLAFFWARTFYKTERIFDSLKMPEKFKPLIGGLLVGILGMFFFKYGILGVGYGGINLAVIGGLSIKILLILGIIKIFATSFTIGSGGSGGIFAPTLYIGAMFGAAIGLVAQHFLPGIIQEPGIFALIGMGALFAGAARAPVTALVMIPEMTNNHQLLIPMIIVSSVSYLIALRLTKSSMYLKKLENKGLTIKSKENVLEDVLVEDVMSRHLDSVMPEMKVSEVLPFILKKKHPGFPVVDSKNQFYGFVKIYDLKNIKETDMEKIRIGEIVDKNYPRVYPSDNVYHALNIMTRHDLGRIPVIIQEDQKNYIMGIISKTDIIKAYESAMK